MSSYSFNYQRTTDFPRYTSISSIAVGEESVFIRKQEEFTINHQLLPASTVWETPFRRFCSLKEKWVKETSLASSITEIVTNFSYQQIIGMGPIAIPFILSELKRQPHHWFWALNAITGEDPVPSFSIGRINDMAAAWIRWGIAHGYIR